MVEIIGIIANIFVLTSMSFKSTSVKANIIMRTLNALGSILFIYYGIRLSAWSVVILNSFAAIINTYHIIKMKKTDK